MKHKMICQQKSSSRFFWTFILQTNPGVPLPSPELLKRKILVKNVKNKVNDEIENLAQVERAFAVDGHQRRTTTDQRRTVGVGGLHASQSVQITGSCER